MNKMRYLSPTGMLGSGFQESSLKRGMDAGPAFVGVDSGTTDDGPHQLGAGAPFLGRAAVRRDLRLLLKATRAAGVPLLVGSCGGAGGRANLEWTWDIAAEVAREEGLNLKVALVDAEPDRGYLLGKYRDGRIRALANAPDLDEDKLRAAEHVVCMMGIEPFQEAVDNGADLVLAGRSSDTSIFAALPVKAGLPAGLAWHAAKVLECGAAAVVRRETPDGLLCEMDSEGFVLDPTNPDMRCSPVSVAAHSLYENGDPYLLHEPGGVLDTTRSRYDALDDRRVRVSGSVFRPEPYTVKLEGAASAGYQSLFIGAIRDPAMLDSLDEWLAGMTARVTARVDSIFGRDMAGEYHMNVRVFGRDAVMGPREKLRGQVGHEVGLVMDFLADDQETAHTMAATAGHMALHHPIAQWEGFISGVAFPYAPHVLDRGRVYRFMLNHVLELDDPLEPFRITYQQV